MIEVEIIKEIRDLTENYRNLKNVKSLKIKWSGRVIEFLLLLWEA